MSSKNNDKIRLGLAHKLTITYGAGFSTLLAILFITLYSSIDALLANEVNEDLIEDIEEYQQLYNDMGMDKFVEKLQLETQYSNRDFEFTRLYSQSVALVYSSDMSSWQGLAFNPKAKHFLEWNNDNFILETQDLASHEYPSRIIYGNIGGQFLLQIGESTDDKSDIMTLLQTSFILSFIISLPVISSVFYWLAKRSAQNIKTVANATVAIGNGDFSKRVALQTEELETQQLADNFNQMAARVDSLLKEMREMTDNIAHDLRSPIGRIRAIAEISLTGAQSITAYQEASANTLHECDRLIGLINMMLDVAEVEAGILRSEQVIIDLSDMVLDICDLLEPTAEQKNITINHVFPQDITTIGSFSSIQRMISNLVDNAIKYTPVGGKIDVELIKGCTGVSIIISNTGIGIPSREQKRVFERFFRCDQSRSMAGSGLGLSYSRAVARAHGGEIELISEPNAKTSFIISLPTSN